MEDHFVHGHPLAAKLDNGLAYAAVARAASGGIVLEVGAGGGFYHQVRPSVISIDLRPGAEVDVVGSALALPLRNESASAIMLLNVLHHLPDGALFFRECERVLKPGGRVCLIEPYAGPLSRRIIRPLHHEPWDEDGGWTLPPSGPLTGANMALQVLLIRLISADDYGRFALWQGVSLLLLGIQNALITTPLSVRLGAARDQSETLASDTLFDVANMAMTVGTFVIGRVAALAIEGDGRGTGRAMAISAYLGTQLVYQYARSLAFARLAPFAVIRIDLVFVGVGVFIASAAQVLKTPPGNGNLGEAALLLLYAYAGFENTAAPIARRHSIGWSRSTSRTGVRVGLISTYSGVSSRRRRI